MRDRGRGPLIAGTGHRPEKLGGYTPRTLMRATWTAGQCLLAFERRPREVISGMAVGWDLCLALAAIALDLPVCAAIPFNGHTKSWPQTSRDLWHAVIEKATRVVTVTPDAMLGDTYGAIAGAYHRRNRWMVDQLAYADAGTDDCLLALYDGEIGGGTAACVEYARSQSKRIRWAWPTWERSRTLPADMEADEVYASLIKRGAGRW